MDEFEHILLERKTPEPPSDLAQRIIESSNNRRRLVSFSVFDRISAFLNGFADDLFSPAPVFAVLVLLAFGMVSGFYVEDILRLYDEGGYLMFMENSFQIGESL